MAPLDPRQPNPAQQDPDDQGDAGGYFEIPDDESDDVEENEDGSAVVVLDDKAEADNNPFFANLVETLDRAYLAQKSAELIELIERDIESRKPRDKVYAEGLKRAGLTDDKGEDSEGGFEGGSTVTHPLIIEACVDFASRVVKELLPPEGPVKDNVVGTATATKVEKAKRKVRHMNWQLTKQVKEFRYEMEQGCTQIPPGGAFYLKMWWSPVLGRITCRAIYIDDLYLPYSATSYDTAQRRTHLIAITDQDYEKEIEAGVYSAEMGLIAAGQEPEKTETGKVSDKVEGKTNTGYNDDGERILFETQIWIAVDGDDESKGKLAPYVVTIDQVSRAIVGWYRNWDPDKQDVFEELPIMVEFPFIPWRGAVPLTLFHLIGSLSVAATGALRCLLDSGFVNTIPSLLKLKGGMGSEGGQSETLNPGGITEVRGGLAGDDVAKSAQQLQFNEPSATLFQLLGFLVDAAKGVVRTTFEELADSNANVPVGTTMARYEQGTVVFSSIHARLHAALAKVLEIVHRLNRFYLKDSVTYNEAGEVLARRQDYEGPMDVQPVSDPRIFSDTQRFVQINTIVQRATGNPLYKQREVEKEWLKQMRWPEAERLLVDEPQPKRMNAVNENLAMMMSQPVSAFPEQDHEAHLNTHLPFMMSPVIGALPIVAPKLYPSMLQHIMQHIGLWYVTQYHDQMSQVLGVEVTQMMDDDPEVMHEFDKLVAAATPDVMKLADETFAKLPPIIVKAMQMLQQLSPPMPQDPTVAAAQASQAETQRKGAADQATAQIQAAKLKLDAQKQAQEAQLAAASQQAATQEAVQAAQASEQAQADARAQAAADDMLEKQKLAQDSEKALQDAATAAADREAENQRKQDELSTKVDVNTADNDTALEIARMEIKAGKKSQVKTGTGINPQ